MMESASIGTVEVEAAAVALQAVVRCSDLEYSQRLSRRYAARVYLKREDQQVVRSYKLRGSYNLMRGLSAAQRRRGVVAASAGNHAQGVAFAASRLEVPATIVMPLTTPAQKIERVRHFGGNYVRVVLHGVSFDEACAEARRLCRQSKASFVHPFDDRQVIVGQATIGCELRQQLDHAPDMLLAPVGGGGLLAGLGSYLQPYWPTTQLVAVEPAGAASLQLAFARGEVSALPTLDTFVDGAAVSQVGRLTFDLLQRLRPQTLTVDNQKLCRTMLELYQADGIITEPAGALAVAGLAGVADQIQGKTVVCIVSGGNNDVYRYPEIIARSRTKVLAPAVLAPTHT